MTPRPARALLLPLVLTTGCTTIELSQDWQLDRLRILAVRAIPAEPQPGEQTTFESLLYVPPELTLEGAIWFACLPESADDFGCEIDSELDPETATLEELLEAGFIGFEPAFPPTWTPPPEALDGLTDAEAEEGLSAIVNVTALPEGAEDDSDLELAYKRVPVSRATTPNHNPELTGLLVDGALLEGDTLIAEAGSTHTLEIVLADDAIETYTYTFDDGSTEDRTEEPYVTWYTEEGSFDQTFALAPYLDVEWTAPDTPGEVLLLATLRDRRGGMAWLSLRAQVE